MKRDGSGEDAHRGLSGPVFGREEGPFFDVVRGFRTDAHGGKDGGVQVFDGNGVFDRHQGTFVVEGATYRYAFALEASEMNLKKDYIAKVIGKETIFCDGEPVKCWKISQNGGGIREQFFWVTEDGILQRVLQDGRKQIDLQTGEPGD